MARPRDFDHPFIPSFCCERELWDKAKAKCKEKNITTSDMLRWFVESFVSGQSEITIVNEFPICKVTVQQNEQAINDIDAQIDSEEVKALLEQVEKLRKGERIAFETCKKGEWSTGVKDYYTDVDIRPAKKNLRDKIQKALKANKHLSPEIEKQIFDDLKYLDTNKWSLAETDQI